MSTFEEVSRLLTAAEREFDQRVGAARALAAAGKEAQQKAEEQKQIVIACEEATAFFNSFADERQQKVQSRIETLVTHGVQTIFGEDLTFHVVSEQKANRSEVHFTLKSALGDGTVVETSILDARGGGVAAVVGFLLRLVITLLRQDRPLLVVDEGFAQVSETYLPAVGQFVRELVDQTGVQVLLVTHSEVFTEYADSVYRVTQKSGVSHIEDLTSDTSTV